MISKVCETLLPPGIILERCIGVTFSDSSFEVGEVSCLVERSASVLTIADVKILKNVDLVIDDVVGCCPLSEC